MSNLVQTVINALTPDMLSRLSALFGESSNDMGKGLTAAVPALLASALQRSSTADGAASLVGLIGQAVAGGNPLDRLPVLLPDEASRASLLSEGRGLTDSLLGGNGGAVAGALASFAGLKAGSASSLLALSAPLVMGAISKALNGAPTAAGVQSLLSEQRSSILGALPPGLGALFGLGGAATSARAAAAGAAASGGDGLRRILPWLIAAAVVLGLILALRGCGARKAEVPPAPAPAPAATPAAPAAPAAETLTLPGGGTISVAPGSIGYGVAKFLDSTEPAPKTFVFDNLNFDTASNAVTPESQPTVDTLTAILKAYPNVRARIVGYTDNQGDPAANKTLSDGRATSVARQMTSAGIAADRLETAGMGESDPIADNSTEEGRAKNRRTELVIVKK